MPPYNSTNSPTTSNGAISMKPTDDVCLCFHVPLVKINSYLAREDPKVASLISECLGAGTGCGWCVPYLKDLHAQHKNGQTPDIPGTAEEYTEGRLAFRKSGKRDCD
jgi:bacterioferritin-associated ferredoxin